MLDAPDSPPPSLAKFPVKTQFLTVGVPESTYMPPPNAADPPVTVNPSRTVSGPSPLLHVTTGTPWLPPSMTVASGPPELRSLIVLPWKLIASG